MGVLKTLLGMVILLAIVVFGYWLYATYTSANADDPIWAQINEYMPEELRKWSCEQMNARLIEEDAPATCADVWQAAIGPNIDAEPILETLSGERGVTAADGVVETRAQSSSAPETSVEKAQPSSAGLPINDY
ncbi:MAG: hypothetical protein KTR19_13130 [Hyphomicrobiales bacterium]|nr:hypothetical protein [Hyphomicrobiales bacterium]